MRRLRNWLLIGLGVVVVAGLAGVIWYHLPLRQHFYTDADTIRLPVEATTPRDILWQPPVELAEALNTTEEDYEPRLSWDGLTLYFVRGKAGENADIYFAKCTPDGWSAAQPLADIISEYDELGPEPSPDGQSLYFYSDRPGGAGGYDVWVTHRGVEGWQPPVNLGPAINTEFNDYGPAVTPDGRMLYFASNRPRPTDTDQPDADAWPATVREDLFYRTYDLYGAALTESGAAAAVPLDALNTPYNEGAPGVSPVGDFVYFTSDRPGGEGGFDLYRARRVHSKHWPPVNLGSSVNTAANELDPGLTHLGYALYFSSDRPIERQQADRPNDYDLYFTSAREVFADVEQQSRPPINWAAVFADVWPYVLWLLLALLALLALWALMGAVRDRRLSLLVRCLLASLMAHAVLMLLFSFWQVAASISDAYRRGRVQVVLATPGSADELTAQIRGELTAIETPAPLPVEPLHAQAAMAVEPLDATTALEIAHVTVDVPEQPEVEVAAADAPEPVDELALNSAPPAQTDQALLPEIAVPNETQQIDRQEPEAVAHVAPQASPLTRSEVTFATSQPVEPPAAVALEPQRGVARDTSRDQTSLAERVEPRSADVSTPSTPSSSMLAAVHRPVALDVTVPDETDRRVETEPATVGPIEAAAFEPVHGRPRTDVATYRPEGGAVVLEPLRTPTQASEFALASDVEVITTEVIPGPSSASSPEAKRADPVVAESLELALPDLEVATVAPATEETVSAQAAGPAAVRQSIADHAVRAAGLAEPLLAKLNPGPMREPVDDPAAMTDSGPRVADAPAEAVQTAALPRMAAAPLRHETPLELSLPSETEVVDEPPPGTIRGRVADAVTGDPLADAVVRLDLPDDAPLVAKTDSAGVFALPVPRLPDFVALSATCEGYVPETANVPAWRLRGSGLTQDFALQPLTEDIVAIESEPEVHHLGNDRWEGRINSQFQKKAEGHRLVAFFVLSEEQVPPHIEAASVSLLAKGVQCPHRLYVNGSLLRKRLSEAPRDGSFGEFSASFDPDLLVEGENTLEIRGVVCNGDRDDFEFVNIQLHLSR